MKPISVNLIFYLDKVFFMRNIHEYIQIPIEDAPACRICFEESRNEMISPCNCKGSHAFIHRHCLDRWYAESGKSVGFVKFRAHSSLLKKLLKK